MSEKQNCPECEAYDRVHDAQCPLHPDHDPTPQDDGREWPQADNE